MKLKLLKLFTLVGTTFFAYHVKAQTTHVVTNVNDVTSSVTGYTGSLRQVADSAVDGDIIRFSPTLLTAAVDSISLSTEIDFNARSITIKGLYSATDTLYISGKKNSRIFSFSSAGKVTLDSLVLINGNGVGSTQSGFGGAVCYYNGTDTIHVNNSTFSGNTAFRGGGVFSYSESSSLVSVSNSTFSGNTVTSDGGGIFCF